MYMLVLKFPGWGSSGKKCFKWLGQREKWATMNKGWAAL